MMVFYDLVDRNGIYQRQKGLYFGMLAYVFAVYFCQILIYSNNWSVIQYGIRNLKLTILIMEIKSQKSMSSNSLTQFSQESDQDCSQAFYVGAGRSKIKTELCRAYVEGEICKFGQFCKFAHGWHELRSLPQYEKPVRRKCHGYWGTNECRYGMSCKFEHHKPDWTSKLILRMHNRTCGQSRLLNVLNS